MCRCTLVSASCQKRRVVWTCIVEMHVSATRVAQVNILPFEDIVAPQAQPSAPHDYGSSDKSLAVTRL